MIDYRSFRNTDPPALCAIWRHNVPQRARYQPLTPALLESTVLSKPFFDPHGLIVAVAAGEPVGFVHAGFAASADGAGLDYSCGTTCMLLTRPGAEQDAVARELLHRSEQYLLEKGAQQLWAGATSRVAPFYLGLYGGAAVSGILASDTAQLQRFGDAAYTEAARTLIMQRSLAGFRPVVDRHQLMLKRSMTVTAQPEPPLRDWWEACTMGLRERFVYSVQARNRDVPCGMIAFWDMEPLASSWGVHARGLCELQLDVPHDREAALLYLLGESLRLLAAAGATLGEVHVSADNRPLVDALARLGFSEIETASVLRKR